jgi:hypothetical protein
VGSHHQAVTGRGQLYDSPGQSDTELMALIKRHKAPIDPFFIQLQQNKEDDNQEPKIMDLSDSISSSSSSPLPIKTGARRGRPRLTEDAELAKQVT